jgi:hypothetical protein
MILSRSNKTEENRPPKDLDPRMKAPILFLLIVCAPLSATAADAPKQITKTSAEEFDVPKEVVDFVSHLVEANDGVRAQYEDLIASAREEGLGLNTSAFVAIDDPGPDAEEAFRTVLDLIPH